MIKRVEEIGERMKKIEFQERRIEELKKKIDKIGKVKNGKKGKNKGKWKEK